MSAPYTVLDIDQGSKFERVWALFEPDQTTEFDLSGYGKKLIVRDSVGGSLLADWTSKLTLGGTAGTITLTLTATDTASIAAYTGMRKNLTQGREIWLWGEFDLELIPPTSADTFRLLQGIVRISPEVAT